MSLEKDPVQRDAAGQAMTPQELNPRLIHWPVVKTRCNQIWVAFVLVILSVAPMAGQTPTAANLQITPLPSSTGAPLTVVPTDGPDIDCSIEEWNIHAAKPYLKLLCPPENAYAPVRVYLKLSWLNLDDVAKDLDKILIRPRQTTRIRSSQSGVMVRMESSDRDGHSQMRWVEFNGVVDMALLTDSRRH